MKKLILILLLTAFSSSVFANNFEGFIKYSIETKGSTIELSDYVKGDNSAMVVNMQGMSIKVIFDLPSKKMFVIMDAQKMAMERSMEEIAKSVPETQTDNINVPVKTGKTKTIANTLSEEYEFEKDGEKVSIWIAKEFGIALTKETITGIMKLSNPASMSGAKSKISLAALGIMEISAKGSKIVATEVTKKTLDKSFFEVPADYNKMPMPNMPTGGNEH